MSDKLRVTSNENKYDILSLKKSIVTRYSLLVTRLLFSLQFLTIIPLRVKNEISEEEIGKASSFFPLVGVFQGALLVISSLLLRKVFPLELTNGLLIFLLVLSNGGFHLDGLADTFDAIASRGDKGKKLSVMKDSTIGPIGVIAVVFTILLKIIALNSLSHLSLLTYHFSLFLMPILSKWAMVISMFHGKAARENGLGRIFIKNVKINTVIFSSFLIILFFVLIVAIQISFYKEIPFNSPTPPLLFFVILFVFLYMLSLISVKFCDKTFGGLTGDTLGAISEITELLFLLMVIAWTQIFT
ncbi:MAG: adenosylcobinamide-GDP ribazoletransferase [Nitrospirota bacterium]